MISKPVVSLEGRKCLASRREVGEQPAFWGVVPQGHAPMPLPPGFWMGVEVGEDERVVSGRGRLRRSGEARRARTQASGEAKPGYRGLEESSGACRAGGVSVAGMAVPGDGLGQGVASPRRVGETLREYLRTKPMAERVEADKLNRGPECFLGERRPDHEVVCWARYECGCQEGIGVLLTRRCPKHGEPIALWSDQISMGEVKQWYGMPSNSGGGLMQEG